MQFLIMIFLDVKECYIIDYKWHVHFLKFSKIIIEYIDFYIN